MKIIQLTDTHLVTPGEALRGLDPERHLRACLAQIEAKHGDARALVVTGDIADRAEPAAYELFRDILAAYRLPPIHLTVGNHDRRSAFGQTFPQMLDCHGHAQQRFDLGDHAGILLDTGTIGTHGGALDPVRLDWLDAQLREDGRPVLMFMHHAPFKVGLKRLDQITLANEDEFWRVIEPFRDRIRHLFFGHMHRNIAGSWRGIPFTVAAGTTHHGLLDFEADLPRHAIVEPGYTVILVRDGTVIVHPHSTRELHEVVNTPGLYPVNTAA